MPTEWRSIGISAKGLTPIILSCAVWGKYCGTRKSFFNVIIAVWLHQFEELMQGPTSDASPAHFIIFTAYYDMELTAAHIPGVANTTANHLFSVVLFESIG